MSVCAASALNLRLTVLVDCELRVLWLITLTPWEKALVPTLGKAEVKRSLCNTNKKLQKKTQSSLQQQQTQKSQTPQVV